MVSTKEICVLTPNVHMGGALCAPKVPKHNFPETIRGKKKFSIFRTAEAAGIPKGEEGKGEVEIVHAYNAVLCRRK